MIIKDKIHSLGKEIQHDPERVKRETEKLISECHKRNDRECEFQCHLLLADIYTHLGDYTSALNALKPAEKLAEIDKSEQQQARLHNYYGTLFWYQGKYSKALEEYLKLKEMAEERK